jgi:NADH:ubiquinone oxidoreductase subunit
MGATVGTRLMIWWKGEAVGRDEFDNRYFKEKKGRRRWVIYGGEPDASAIPADWHAWLHHTVAHPPIGEHAPKRPIFDLPHQPNMTGTPGAYYPSGSLMASGQRPGATGDYEAWKPE